MYLRHYIEMLRLHINYMREIKSCGLTDISATLNNDRNDNSWDFKTGYV